MARECAPGGVRLALCPGAPHPASLGYRLRSATLPENGEGCCGAILREFSDSHFKQPVRADHQKLKAPPPLFSQGAGCAGISIPSLTRGTLPHQREGSGAPKGAGNISNALRRTPNDVGRSPRGAPLRRFSLDPGTAFCEQTGAADRRNALDSAGFHPRSSAPTSPLPDGPT